MIIAAMALLLDDFVPKQFPNDPDCPQATTYGMAECLRGQFLVWDKRLNAEYRLALGRVDPAERVKLRSAQRLWVQFRQADCAAYEAHDGSVSILDGAGCWRDITKARVIELSQMD